MSPVREEPGRRDSGARAAVPRLRAVLLALAVVLALAAGSAAVQRAEAATSGHPATHGAPRASAPPVRWPAATIAAYRHRRQLWNAAATQELVPVGSGWRTVRVDGVVRRYLLSVPAHLVGLPALVVAFHGLNQQAVAFAGRTGLIPATRAAGEALVLPESDGPAFNDGRLGPQGPADDAFALAVVQQLVAADLVDPRRVVVAGFSNGAGMAMEVAGRHPGAVGAFVSIAGDMIAGPAAPRPTGPVPGYLVHGTADHVQPWIGRRAEGPTWPAYISVPSAVQLWVKADSAAGVTTRTVRGGARAGTVTIRTWHPGPSGAGVTFYEVDGMGHRWPLGPSPTPGRPAGTDGVDATSLVVSAAATARSPAGSATGS
jgi:polyhydroxybutyrate depolymerase